MKNLDRDKIVAEKTLTYIYPKLCTSCREKFKEGMVKMGLASAEDFAEAMSLPF